MRFTVNRYYNSKTQFYEYTPLLDNSCCKIKGYASNVDLFKKPVFFCKKEGNERFRLEENFLASLFEALREIIPPLRPKYTLYSNNVMCGILKYSGKFYFTEIDKSLYRIRGGSGCIVTIWKDNSQIGMVKRIKNNIKNKSFETIEVLCEKDVNLELFFLFVVFGWEKFVGVRTYATISFDRYPINKDWKPNDDM